MRFPYAVLLSACALMWTATLLAQSPNGVINGLVVDPSNKVIAGADILVIEDATGVNYSGKTNEDGIYVVPNLPPGTYRLQVSTVGFKTLIKPDIVLNIQDALSINFTLPVGATFETVTVEGGASMINTTDASVSTVVDQTYVKNMPLNGRSLQDLILLTPGIVTQTPQISGVGAAGLGQSGEFSVNGQRTEANYYTVDGVSANVGAAPGLSMIVGAGASGSVAAATALGTTQALVSVDALQEFRVQSSTYSAQYGRNPGGQFAFETKSGSNQWHGTAYDYWRNGALDASDWFNNYFSLKEPSLRQNDFGGTLGGAVDIPGLYDGKNKTFFFVSYEGLRLAAPQAATVNFVPDATLRAIAHAPLNQVLNAFPVANGLDDIANGIAEYIASWSTPASLDSTSIRLDHVISDKTKLFFRFGETPSSAASRGTSAALSTPTVYQNLGYGLKTYTAGTTSVFTNRLTDDFRLNYTQNESHSSLGIDALGGSTPVDLILLCNLSLRSSPAIQIAYGGYNFLLQQQESSAVQRQWNLTDTLNLSLGRHQLRFGADFRRLAPVAIPENSSVAFIYLSKSAVEANTNLQVLQSFAPAYPLYMNFSAFAQDEWKLSQRLSVSLGVRWEVNPAPGVTRGLAPYTLQGASPNTWTLAPQGTPLWRTTWYNFAPRLGVAYVLPRAAGHELVLRGGAGVFFDTGQQLGSVGFKELGFSAENCCPSGSFPDLAAPFPPIDTPPTTPFHSSVFAFSPHLQLPYTLQWSVSIEQALGKSQSLSISHVGAHATRLLQYNFYEPPSNPDLTSAFWIKNGLTSDYDALQVQFRRRLSQGLTALASYTWSHCIDYGSANFYVGYERGNCDFDVRQNFSGALSYNMPNIGRNRLSFAALRHWGLDDRLTVRTSFPVTLDGSAFLDSTTGQELYSPLDRVSGQPVYLYGANCDSMLQARGYLAEGQGCPGGRAINPCAFVSAGNSPSAPCPTGMVGKEAPRNFARGFGAWQMDLAIRRDFRIHERLKLQFRAEAFNVFNHPSFGSINSQFGQLTFGQATGTLASSLGVLNPLYQTGGARSMQLALKLVL